jgi:hypothetical protein
MSGIADVQTRIQDIVARFEGPPAKTTADSSTTDFAAALAKAQAPTSASGADPTTGTSPSGTLNRAGVDPTQWAQDFLTALGAPVTPSNVQAISAWEQAEGTKAAFNPLATTQGGYTGETQFNSVGVKNFATYDDGIAANVKVITNGLYGNILSALQQGTSAMDVAQAVAASPWGTGTGVERVLSSQQ